MNALKLTSFAKLYARNNLNNVLPIKSVLQSLSTTTKANVRETDNSKATESNSFVMNLFTGERKVEQLFPFPKVLTEEYFTIIYEATEPIFKIWRDENYALKNDLNGKIDEKLWRTLRYLGCFGLQMPLEYGGIAMNNTQYARLGEVLGGFDLSIGIALGAHQSIGFKGILLYGNEEQKQKYLPDLTTGKKVACFCFTEPSAGSDASGIKTRAELSADGKHYVLNGSKIMYSYGGIADLFTVFAKTAVTNAEGKVKDKVTAFIVERGPGLTSSLPESSIGFKGLLINAIIFDNVSVPVENVLGSVGEGFKVAMHILNNVRLGMAGALSGTMRAMIAKAEDHAKAGIQFGNTSLTYELVHQKLARMSIAHYVTESMAYMLSGIMDNGCTEFQLEAAISKIYASEAAWFVVDEALQLHGGMGYMRDAGIKEVLRNLRLLQCFEVTNEMSRLFVARTGIEYAERMIFGQTIRIKHTFGLSSGPSLSEYVNPQLANNAAIVSKAIESFGASVQHLLIKYNKNILNKQILLNRLANAAIDIYIMVVVLSRVTRALNQNLSSAEHEMNMAIVICNEAADRIEEYLKLE